LRGKNPLKRVISPQTPLFLNFLVKVFGERGVLGEREPFFQKGFLSPKYF